MVIVEGSMKVRLPGKEWQEVKKTEMIVVPKDASFDIDTAIEVAYICYYK